MSSQAHFNPKAVPPLVQKVYSPRASVKSSASPVFHMLFTTPDPEEVDGATPATFLHKLLQSRVPSPDPHSWGCGLPL